MDALINNGFLTDVCLDRFGCEVHCKGTLKVHYYSSGDRFDRNLHCHGVPEKARHRFHWLFGSVFHGHHKLDAADTCGVVQCFPAGKSVEIASQDTGLYRGTVGGLFDRLRIAVTLLVQQQREEVVTCKTYRPAF